MANAPSTSVAPAGAATTTWYSPIVRAVPLFGVGLTITFTADLIHTFTSHGAAQFGLVMFAILGLSSAIVLGTMAARLPRSDAARGLYAPLAIIAAVAGILAALSTSGGLSVLLLIAGGYAVLAGAWELVWGIRHRGRSIFARDALAVGGGTLALAVALALTGDSVSTVGFVGAYAVVVGVFLVIAAFSAKWALSPKEQTP